MFNFFLSPTLGGHFEKTYPYFFSKIQILQALTIYFHIKLSLEDPFLEIEKNIMF